MKSRKKILSVSLNRKYYACIVNMDKKNYSDLINFISTSKKGDEPLHQWVCCRANVG